jgi:hypothetical protein
MTNEELQAAIDAAWANHGRSLWPPTRKLLAAHYHALMAIQFQRACGGPPSTTAAEPLQLYPDSVYRDAKGEPIRPPQCVHGRLMPTRYSEGEPCDLCEADGNGVALPGAEIPAELNSPADLNRAADVMAAQLDALAWPHGVKPPNGATVPVAYVADDPCSKGTAHCIYGTSEHVVCLTVHA